jgi:hypothetical protein
MASGRIDRRGHIAAKRYLAETRPSASDCHRAIHQSVLCFSFPIRSFCPIRSSLCAEKRFQSVSPPCGNFGQIRINVTTLHRHLAHRTSPSLGNDTLDRPAPKRLIWVKSDSFCANSGQSANSGWQHRGSPDLRHCPSPNDDRVFAKRPCPRRMDFSWKISAIPTFAREVSALFFACRSTNWRLCAELDSVIDCGD